MAFFSGLAAFGVGEDEGCTGGAGAFAGGSDHAPDDLAAAAQGCRVRATGATPGEPALVKAEANTNISCGKTVIPAVRYEIPAGTVELVTEVLVREWESLGPSRGPLVFAPNCWALPGVYVAMREFYPLMPTHVGLLGFDNTEWAGVASPSVSVVTQPAFEEGAEACRILLDLIQNKGDVDPHQVLDCHVRWGATTM